MAEQNTTNFGFSYYAQYDVNWHTGMNNNFINLDNYLHYIGAGPNFIPHTLWQLDSDSDGIPDLWQKTDDSCTVTPVLATSEIYGFAKKIQLTISNASGVTKYPTFKITGLTPPNRQIVFSAWLKSADLAVQLRINDGISDFDSTAQVEAAAVRREVEGEINIASTDVDCIIRVTVPDGTVTKLVEVHMPMLSPGDKMGAYVPSFADLTAIYYQDLWTGFSAPDDNKILRYNHTTGKWEKKSVLGTAGEVVVTHNANDITWSLDSTASPITAISIDDTDSPYTAAPVVNKINLYLCDTDGGVITFNLPAVASSSGMVVKIKNTGTSGNNITVDGNAAETIDGNATITVADLESPSLYCDGSAWWII